MKAYFLTCILFLLFIGFSFGQKSHNPTSLKKAVDILVSISSDSALQKLKTFTEPEIISYFKKWDSPYEKELRNWRNKKPSGITRYFNRKGIIYTDNITELIALEFLSTITHKPSQETYLLQKFATVENRWKNQLQHYQTADTLFDIHIPKDLEDCYKQINSFWNDSTKQAVKNWEEEIFRSKLHHGFGMWLRNNWQLWRGSRLSIYFNQMGIYHPDDMSDIILTSYHRNLNGLPIQLDEQINYYKKYWSKKGNTQFYAETENKKRYTTLDTALVYQADVTSIKVVNCDTLDPRIIQFKNLKEIHFEQSSSMNWEQAFNLLAQIPSLESLFSFDNQNVKYLGLEKLTQVKTLWIDGDSLIEILPNIEEMSSLKELSITECKNMDWRRLLLQLQSLDSLKVLDLSTNALHKIPKEISGIKRLEEITLDDNNFTHIPKSIKQMSSIKDLDFFSNKIRVIRIKKGELQNLRIINLCYNNLRIFPVQLTKLDSLESILMWFNKTSIIPNKVGDFKSLKRLNISYNKISTLPIRFSQIQSLTLLDAGHNYLDNKAIKPILHLKSLERLILSDNDITELPKDIDSLKKLEVLYVDANNLTKLVDGLTRMKSLKQIEVGNNKNLDIDQAISILTNMKSIESIGLTKLGLKLIPEQICEIETLKTFSLYQNNIPIDLQKIFIEKYPKIKFGFK